MSSDMGDLFNDWNKAKQAKRAGNRAFALDYLRLHGIEFEEKNNGAHLLIKVEKRTGDIVHEYRIDFWPGTGLWSKACGGKQHRGIKSLVAHIKKES